MFVFKEWEKFCEELSEAGHISVTAKSLLDKVEKENFVVLKHDIEGSPQKALEMAKIESKYKHKGSYYFQAFLLKNERSIDVIREITMLGHEVSYHHDVMDQCGGNIDKAIEEFEINKEKFESIGIDIKTICQHGNPVAKRNGYSSNRDFFRNDLVQQKYKNIYELMVNYKQKIANDYRYISDSGYGWKVIFDPENNDRVDSSNMDMPITYNQISSTLDRNENVIISTHPHRWYSSVIKAKGKHLLYKVVKRIYGIVKRNKFFKSILEKLYFVAKRF